MKSKISALMDGELGEQDASNVIRVIQGDDDLREEWKAYHLIGDTLRQSSRLSTDVSFSVNQKLKTEPTVLFPKASNIPKQQKYKVFAFSMAASVVAMVSAWAIMYNASYVPQQTLVAENPSHNSNLTAVPVMVSSPTVLNNYPPVEINEYLFVHREFSPGTNMRGQVTNVNNVNEYSERYGR